MVHKACAIFQMVLTFCLSSHYAYPVYGTKRYSSDSGIEVLPNPSWDVQALLPYREFVRTQRYHPDEYYYGGRQEVPAYPIYVQPPRTSKYEVYQSVMPYYYDERAILPVYKYYPGDLDEDFLQETERQMREDAQPIGQEVLYENEAGNDNIDDLNAAFLQNLMASQMYRDRERGQYDDYYSYSDEDEDEESLSAAAQEDDDVRELKQLSRSQSVGPNMEDRLRNLYYENKPAKTKSNKRNFALANKKEEYREHGANVFSSEDLTFTDRKPQVNGFNEFASTTTAAPVRANKHGGQKEEVLFRPAVLQKNEFPEALTRSSSSNNNNKNRKSSVYDTIKHMLDMETSLNKVSRCHTKVLFKKYS